MSKNNDGYYPPMGGDGSQSNGLTLNQILRDIPGLDSDITAYTINRMGEREYMLPAEVIPVAQYPSMLVRGDKPNAEFNPEYPEDAPAIPAEEVPTVPTVLPAMRLPGVELTLGTEFNDCSIASAEASMRAAELFDTPHLLTTRTLHMIDDSLAHPVVVDTITLTPKFDTPQGHRNAEFLLVRESGEPDGPVRLVSVTRDDVAVPVASFARRHNSLQCDYVQIGREMSDESFIVTPEDEQGSRKDIIESVRSLLNADILGNVIGSAVQEASRDISLEKLREEIDDHVTGNLFGKKEIDEEGAALLVLEELGPEGKTFKQLVRDTDQTTKNFSKRAKKTFLKTQRELYDFFCEPSYAKVLDGEVPGSNTPIGRNLLLVLTSEVLEQNNSDNKRDPVSGNDSGMALRIAQETADKLGVDDQFDRVLGPPKTDEEILLNLVDKVAESGDEFRTTKKLLIGNTVGSAEIIVNIKPDGPTTKVVSVCARPLAMPDKPFKPVSTFVLDRCQQVPLKVDEIKELAGLLNPIASTLPDGSELLFSGVKPSDETADASLTYIGDRSYGSRRRIPEIR